jgi:hypothetical protein
MRAIIVLLSATAALATPGTPGDVPINCARANANYCMGADIILRCDSNAIGTPGRCTPNLSGYPPAGGVASCWQSSEEAGDAACEKNVSENMAMLTVYTGPSDSTSVCCLCGSALHLDGLQSNTYSHSPIPQLHHHHRHNSYHNLLQRGLHSHSAAAASAAG